MNETLNVIAKRYSCRDFKNEMPSDEILQAIAEAAIQAPSGMNRQAWQLYKGIVHFRNDSCFFKRG